jgi:polar amino acid transport system substrate-binding protein
MRRNVIMKWSKIAAVLLAVSVMAASLAGCQSKQTQTAADTSSEQTEAETETEEPEADSQEDVEVTKVKVGYTGLLLHKAYLNEDGEAEGYDIEVLREVFKRLPQYEVEFVATGDFPSLFSGTQSGNYQIAASNLSYSDERGENYLYTHPYGTLTYLFVSRDGSIDSFESAVGKTLLTTAGLSAATAFEQWNEDHPDQQVNIQYTESANILQDIEEGRGDFTVTFSINFNEEQAEYNRDLVGVEIPADDLLLITQDAYVYFLLPKDQEQLRTDVDEVLKELAEDGTLKTLSEEFLGEDVTPPASLYETARN